MNTVVDYDQFTYSLSKVLSSGIQVVMINDHKSIFYPVLSLNIPHFSYSLTVEDQRRFGESIIKCMISYYNA